MSIHHQTSSRLAIAVGIGSWVLGGAQAWAATKPPVDLAAGRAAYEQHCARCHGATGQGDGLDAKRFFPRPRNFTAGVYKIRTTVSGTAPTDDDLFRSLSHGLAGSGMPDWKHLDEATRWQLVYYLKSLSSTFQDAPPEPVALGTDPGRQTDLAKGRAVYEKLGCAACHGAHGRANGPSAATLVDNWGAAIRAADLTQAWNYRGGAEAQAIVARMMSGIDGTPMPSYAEATTPEEAWQLAYYVQSLQEPTRWAMIARASHVEGELPSSVDDPHWAAAPAWTVRLRPAPSSAGEVTAPPTVNAVVFQALSTDEAIAFRLTWDDPTESRQDPADVIALALRPAGVTGDVVTLQAWPLNDSPPLDLCLWSAKDGQAYERLSRNYDSALHRNGRTDALPSQAAYDDGRWTLVIQRPLKTTQWPDAAALEAGQLHPVAFVVWDGSHPDQRLVSMWVDVGLDRPALREAVARTPQNAWVWPSAGAVLIIALALVFQTKHSKGDH